ncbi:MAG: glycosyltransferase [Desulfovibrio sp.]|jgi:glycosyltransferase involved in cell wall biosynthesis|nr:glycosyltransferase [Desulfovibrio sp.]
MLLKNMIQNFGRRGGIVLNKPFFSIITATLNSEAVISALLDSLALQTCRDFEVIIQDGASVDSTVLLAKTYDSRLPAILIESERDTGIYDAWNKAIKRARGEWILFLGADDCLYSPSSLKSAKKVLFPLGGEISYAGFSLLLTTAEDIPAETCRPSARPYEELAGGMSLPHPALFHRKRLFSENMFSTDYAVSGDYDFLCRTLSKDNYTLSDMVLCRMRAGGVSGSPLTMLRGELESLSISCRHFPGALRGKIYTRICRSYLIRGVNALLGGQAAFTLADMLRKSKGKTALWSGKQDAYPTLHALPEQPLVSLLIVTLGRKEPLHRLFSSLNRQTYQNIEILIADQNPPGFLDDVIRTLDERIPVKHLLLQEKGLSQARNALLPLANGNIIAFPDDDCWYLPETLERITNLFAHEAHLGAIYSAWRDSDIQCFNNQVHLSGVSNIFRKACSIVQFYRREATNGIYFDTTLGVGAGTPYGAGEDTDFLLQVFERGVAVGRTDDVLVCHPVPEHHAPMVESSVYSYALGRMRILHKHNFSFWFVMVNILYPLSRILYEGLKAWPYCKAMFLGLLRGFFAVRKAR